MKSAEVSLLLKPVPDPNAPSTGAASPLGSDLSPSDSRATLEPGATDGGAVDGAERPSNGTTAASAAAKPSCPVEQLLCASAADGGMPAPLLPPPPQPSSSSSSASPAGRKGSLEERRTSLGTAVRRSSAEERREGGMEPVLEGQGGVPEGKPQQGEPSADRAAPLDPLSDPLSKDWNESKDKGSGNRMPQSMSR